MNRRVRRALWQGKDAKWQYYYNESIRRQMDEHGGFLVPPHLAAEIQRKWEEAVSNEVVSDVDSRP